MYWGECVRVLLYDVFFVCLWTIVLPEILLWSLILLMFFGNKVYLVGVLFGRSIFYLPCSFLHNGKIPG